METCALCRSSDCDCALSKTVDLVRALLRKELDHLESAREALLRRVSQLAPAGASTREELGRLNGLIHRLWVRILAVEDFGESFDREVTRALKVRRVDMTVEQGRPHTRRPAR